MSFSRRGDVGRVRAELEAEKLLDHHVDRLVPGEHRGRPQARRANHCLLHLRAAGPLGGELVSEAVVQVLRDATEKVAAAGLQLVIEVSELTPRSVDVCRRVNNPALGINWDPGNAFIGGEDGHTRTDSSSPDRSSNTSTSRTGQSIRDLAAVVGGRRDHRWASAITSLKEDGFDGYISMETHVRPKIESTLRCLERVRRLVHEIEAGPPLRIHYAPRGCRSCPEANALPKAWINRSRSLGGWAGRRRLRPAVRPRADAGRGGRCARGGDHVHRHG